MIAYFNMTKVRILRVPHVIRPRCIDCTFFGSYDAHTEKKNIKRSRQSKNPTHSPTINNQTENTRKQYKNKFLIKSNNEQFTEYNTRSNTHILLES